jgi:hypothetical protein
MGQGHSSNSNTPGGEGSEGGIEERIDRGIEGRIDGGIDGEIDEGMEGGKWDE